MTESGAGYPTPLFSYDHELLLIMTYLRVFFPLKHELFVFNHELFEF